GGVAAVFEPQTIHSGMLEPLLVALFAFSPLVDPTVAACAGRRNDATHRDKHNQHDSKGNPSTAVNRTTPGLNIRYVRRVTGAVDACHESSLGVAGHIRHLVMSSMVRFVRDRFRA